MRRISAAPGRKASTEPGSARSARVTASATCVLDARARIAAEIARLDRKGAALALDHRRVAEKLRDARAVDGRRHHQKLQVLAQALLRVAREREAEIGVERALVEFVEQHRRDARRASGSSRIRRVNTPSVTTSMRVLRETFEPKRTRKPTVSPTVSPSVSAMRVGGGARGEPARLQHEDLAVLAHGSSRQHQRHARGLAGAGRRDQHGGVARAQRRGQRRQRVVDGKR